ncbi:MAG: RNA polymerase subunit sigma-70 [Planctomycetota bacterium]|nr:MAG: RNA polymerase subunit sigma-70 [Planctomycetota bacterium]
MVNSDQDREHASPESDDGELVQSLLKKIEQGNSQARKDLFDLLYTQLYRQACRHMHGQGPNHSLQATALVHEVYIRLIRGSNLWNDRKHFLTAASLAMRHILIDHARRRRKAPKGKLPASALDDLVVEYQDRALDLEALSEALEALSQWDPVMSQAVDLRFFGGASVEETAQILGLSVRTFQRRWSVTRAWLFRQIQS